MRNLLRMDLYRMVRQKTLWLFSGIIFVMTFAAPLLTRLFTTLLMGLAGEESVTFDPIPLSTILRAPFGGLTSLLVFFTVFSAVFFYADLSHGYIKNLAGHFPRISMLSVSKFVVILLPMTIMFFVALLGSLLGNLIAFGIDFDDSIGNGVLEFLTKMLMAWAVVSVVLLSSAGIRNKTLGIILGVFLGAGMMTILYVPINLVFQKLFKMENFFVNNYLPDQLLTLANMEQYGVNLLNGVISSVIIIILCVALTMLLNSKKDIK